MQEYSPTILRAVVKAAVMSVGLGVTDAQAADIARRVIAADQPEITADGGVRLASGASLTDVLARHRQAAPHLFQPPESTAQNDANEKRAKLKALKAGDRLEAANADCGVTGAWVRDFRQGGAT